MTKKVERTRGSGSYTEAGFNSFVKSALRRASSRWKPKTEVLKKARVSKGVYLCSGCNEHVPVTVVENGKRVRGIEVDHVIPVISPDEGFTTWDNFINRLFVEENGLRVLCKSCHNAVTKQQVETATARRAGANKKDNNE